jgi:hypothetical protein
MRIAYLTCAVLLLAMIVVGCKRKEPEGAATEKPAPDVTADFDQDGLADVDEIELYHTSPETRDTDGDGYDDYQEIHEFGYDPSNPTKFNPLVADVPRIDIELTTPPKVTVVYRKSTGGTETVETGRTDTTATTVMRSESAEQNWSVTASATVEYSLGKWGGSVSVSSTYGQSHSWTNQQSQENQVALSEMRSHSRNSDLTQEGGHVKVGVAITNAGHIPFTVQNLSLTAFRLEGTRLWPVAQLEADSARPFFEMGTWAPGQRVDNILFVAKDVTLSEVEKILNSDLVVQVSKYELKDESGQSFGHRMAAVDAACARILVDYGGTLPSESYMVSTRTAPDEHGVSLNTILNTLGITYRTDTAAWTYRKRTPEGRLATGDGATETRRTKHGLVQLRDVGTNPQEGGYWLITHEVPIAPSGSDTHRYDLLEGDYKLEDIRLKARQTVQLAYVRDPDRDDLETRAENSLGTDPWEPDTDGDGVADGDEIQAGTDPLWNNALPLPRIESVKVEKFGRQVDLTVAVAALDEGPAERLRIQWGDDSLADEVFEPRDTVTCSHPYAAFGEYKIVLTPYGGPRSPGEPYDIEVSTAPALLRNLTLQFGTESVDRLHQIAVDREGNMYLAGDVPDMFPFGLEPKSVFLAKFNRTGENEWIEQFGERNEMPGGLATDGAGNVHLATYHNVPANRLLRVSSLRTYSPVGEPGPTLNTRTKQRTPGQGPLNLGKAGYLVETLEGQRLFPNLAEDDRPVRDLAVDESGDICYYATERWEMDCYPTVSRLLVERFGASAGDKFATSYFGDVFISARPGGDRWDIFNTRRPDLQKLVGEKTAWDAYLPEDVSVQAIAVDLSGGLYACGYRRLEWFRGNVGRESEPGSFLARYDPNGNLDWIKHHGDDQNDQSVAVAVDGLGNAYVADIAASRTQGPTDIRLVKYDRKGEVLWMQQFGTRLHDVPFSVAVWPLVLPDVAPRNAEAVYVAGITQGDLNDEDADPVPETSTLSAFLVSYDADGNRTFLEQFPLGAEVPQNILERRDITLLESCAAWMSEVIRPTSSDEFRKWKDQPEKYTADLRESRQILPRSWWRKFPVSAFVTTDEKGNVYLAGSSETSLDPDYTNKGSADIFLMRFTPNPEVRR